MIKERTVGGCAPGPTPTLRNVAQGPGTPPGGAYEAPQDADPRQTAPKRELTASCAPDPPVLARALSYSQFRAIPSEKIQHP